MNACERGSWLVPVLVALLVCLSGCVKSKVTVFVNPDGSGHLVVSRLFGRQAIDTFEMQRRQMDVMELPDGPGMEEMKARMKADPFYDEKALQKEAKSYGVGVKLVKSRRMDVDGGRGSIAVYSFRDINDVFVSTDASRFQRMMYGGYMPDRDEDDGESRGRRGKGGIEFSLQTGEVSRLKVLLPAFEAADDDSDGSSVLDRLMDGSASAANEDDDGADSAETAEWFDASMMAYPTPVGFDYRYAQHYAGSMMAQGAAIGVEVAINGKIVTSSASHTNAANGSRVVLVDMDSSRRDKKTKKPGNVNELYSFYDFNRLMRGLTKMPGTIVETNREVVVTFK